MFRQKPNFYYKLLDFFFFINITSTFNEMESKTTTTTLKQYPSFK